MSRVSCCIVSYIYTHEDAHTHLYTHTYTHTQRVDDCIGKLFTKKGGTVSFPTYKTSYTLDYKMVFSFSLYYLHTVILWYTYEFNIQFLLLQTMPHVKYNASYYRQCLMLNAMPPITVNVSSDYIKQYYSNPW